MKNYIIGFICLSIIVFVTMLFVGCNNTTNSENISDLRYGIFEGQNENFNATFLYGIREEPYRADGVSSSVKIEFGIITVTFENRIDENKVITYLLVIDENEYSGEMEKSPYSDDYMANIGKICNKNSSITLSIKVGDQEETIELENVSLNFELDYEKAMEIGLDALSENISEIEKNNESYEIYVKILSDQKYNFGKYYWGVSVVSPSQRHNVLISTSTQEILLKN